MKVLSMKGLWGYLIATGIKDVENRRTLKNIRGWHLIHISKNFNEKIDINIPFNLLSDSEKVNINCSLWKHGIFKETFKKSTGSIIGAMYIEDCQQGYKRGGELYVSIHLDKVCLGSKLVLLEHLGLKIEKLEEK